MTKLALFLVFVRLSLLKSVFFLSVFMAAPAWTGFEPEGASVCSDLSLSSHGPSGMVGNSGTLRWLCRFWAVRRDTIHCSLLWLGLLHSGEA